MNKVLLVIFLLLLGFNALADVPPPATHTRLSVDLIILADGDFSQNTFYLVYPNAAEQISIIDGETTVVSADDKVGARRFAALYAIKNSDLKELSNTDVEKLLVNGKFAAAQKLLSHEFRIEVPIIDLPGFQKPTYLIENQNGSITISESATLPLKAEETEPIVRRIITAAIVAAVLILLGIAAAAFLIFRKLRKKRKISV